MQTTVTVEASSALRSCFWALEASVHSQPQRAQGSRARTNQKRWPSAAQSMTRTPPPSSAATRTAPEPQSGQRAPSTRSACGMFAAAAQSSNQRSIPMFVIPGADSSRLSPGMRRDLADMHAMRTTGVSYAAFEARWSLIHVDELILDAEEGQQPSVLMGRVTNFFWKTFLHEVDVCFSITGYALYVIRKERVNAKDDPVRKRKYGTGYSDWVYVDVPFVVPFGAVDVSYRMDESFRTVVVPLDDQGRPRKDVRVLYSRRGGVNIKAQRFETECGALLEDWRRYNELMRMRDEVARQNARLMPYVEHVPESEQSRLGQEARRVEELLHAPEVDAHGYEIAKESVLRKVEKPEEAKVQSFVEVPADRRLSSTQPAPRLTFDADKAHEKWVAQLAATLQVPLRHLRADEHKGLGSGGSEAAVQDDMGRAVRAAGERRNELVDALAEVFERIYGERPKNTHLPTASHLTPQLLFELQERGVMGEAEVKDEMSLVLGLKRQRFT